MELSAITEVAKLGISGLCVYLMYRLSSNHIEHNTQAIDRLHTTIDELLVWLKSQK